MRRITIKDIAQIAGVSRGTVDRVLNKRGKVAPEVEAKVSKIARDLGYEKNLLASQLALSNTHNLAVVLPSPQKDAFWEQPKKGMLAALNYFKHYGIKLIFFEFNQFSENDFNIQFQNAINSKPEAILLAPTLVKETLEVLNQEPNLDIPIITINTEMKHKYFSCFIGQNSFDSGYLAGRLISLQIKKDDQILIMNLGSELHNSTHYVDKVNGVTKFFEDNHIVNKIHQYDFYEFRDKQKMSSFYNNILQSHPKISSIFFTNSRAYELIEACPSASEKFIVGYDLLDKNVDLLKSGEIDVLINQNSFQQGYLSILNFLNINLHNDKIKKKQYLPIDIVIKENVEFYENNDEYFLNIHRSQKII